MGKWRGYWAGSQQCNQSMYAAAAAAAAAVAAAADALAGDGTCAAAVVAFPGNVAAAQGVGTGPVRVVLAC
eukprot:1158924-Pelagomonas_calceolata.AAC.12